MSLLTACAGTAPGGTAAVPSIAPEDPDDAIQPGHLLVAVRRAGLPPGLAALAAATGEPETLLAATPSLELGGEALRPGRLLIPDADAPVFLLHADTTDAAATRAALARVAADPRVRYAEPDRLRRRADLTPNDPLFATKQDDMRQSKLPRAWEILTTLPRQPVTVAVLDTGVLLTHPDLAAGIARKANGEVDGYDFVSVGPTGAPRQRTKDPTDPGTSDDIWSSGLHGTHVSGIIGARGNNMLGIAGVCWDCRILAARVLGVGDEASGRKGGTGLDSDIVDALRWVGGAAIGPLAPPEKPAQVVNLSFGGGRLSFTVKQAVDELIHKGISVVAAAGNNGRDTTGGAASDFFPGGLDNVVSVGSISPVGLRSGFSSFGERVDLLAPGEDITSTYRSAQDFDYGLLTGTSQAAPHVAGAVGMLKTLWPAATPAQVVDVLWETADASKRCDNTPEQGCGAGLLDTAALLQVAAAQARCTCPQGQYCLRGGCRLPVPRHTSVLATPVLEPGCQAAPGRPSAPWALAGAALAIATIAARRRDRRSSGSSGDPLLPRGALYYIARGPRWYPCRTSPKS